MIVENEIYPVISEEFDSYIKAVNKKRIFVSVVIVIIMLSFSSYIAIKLDSDFPIFIFFIFTGIILFGVFVWSLKIWSKTLMKFKNTSYELTPFEIKLKSPDLDNRAIPLDNIAVIDKSFKGTILVKGNFWTKFEYYRPKNSSVSITFKDRIFIPSVTKDYDMLIEKIKFASVNQKT